MASARRVADTMISIPHPYPPGRASQDICLFAEEWRSGSAAHFAMALLENPGNPIGYTAIKSIDREHAEAELSFWIDESQAGRGYVTEAANQALDFAFGTLGLNRICAYHMLRNPASGNVLAKIGMRREGVLRQRVYKWGKFEDVALWAVLREDRGP